MPPVYSNALICRMTMSGLRIGRTRRCAVATLQSIDKQLREHSTWLTYSSGILRENIGGISCTKYYMEKEGEKDFFLSGIYKLKIDNEQPNITIILI